MLDVGSAGVKLVARLHVRFRDSSGWEEQTKALANAWGFRGQCGMLEQSQWSRKAPGVGAESVL